MAILSPIQILQVALDSGFKGADAVKATAIAMAESGGNTTIVNSIGATGLWQIYPAQAGSTNATQNGQQAYAKYLSQGWCAWSVVNDQNCPYPDQRNNSYTQFMGVAQSAWNILTNNPSTGQLPPEGGTIGDNPSGGSSGGSSGGNSNQGSSSPGGGGFGQDVVDSFTNQFSGPVVLAVGLGFVIIGFLMWKGSDTVKVINQGVRTSKLPATVATAFA